MDDTIDIGKATAEGIQKEKFLHQGTVQQEARNAARRQFRREIQLLKAQALKSAKK